MLFYNSLFKWLLIVSSISLVSCSSQQPIHRAKKQASLLKPNAKQSLNGDYEKGLWNFLASSHKTETSSKNGSRVKLAVIPKQQKIKIALLKNKTELDSFYKSYIDHGSYIQFTKSSHIWGKPPLVWGYSPGNEVLAIDNKTGQLRFYDIETEQIWLGFLPISTRGTGRPRTIIIRKLK